MNQNNYTQDIKYNIKGKKIEEKIIIIGIINNLNSTKSKQFDDYFMDITLKILPKNIGLIKLCLQLYR